MIFQFRRYSSDARAWLARFTHRHIPAREFEVSYSRASGAGGQKVNKTSSKATISLSPDRWLNPQFCYWLPEEVRRQLGASRIRYETKSRGIVVHSDGSRSRDANTEDCFRKLADEIKAHVFFAADTDPEDVAKWDELRKESTDRRLQAKKRHSDKKKSRSKHFDI